MIGFTKSYKTSDGTLVGSIPEAQLHELSVLFAAVSNNPDVVAKLVLDKKDVFVDILTTTATSKPKARALHGGTKKRTQKTTPTNQVGSTTPS